MNGGSNMFNHSASQRRYARFILATIVLAAATTSALAGSEKSASNETPIVEPRFVGAIDQARKFVTDLARTTQAPGLTVAVAVDGALVWSEAYGVSNREEKTPTTRDTQFEIGSVSKLFTIAALAKLDEAGTIDLDAGVQAFVPTYTNRDERITPRLLAGHLAGIRHYNGMSEILSQEHCERMDEALAIFQNDPLLHEPGSKYHYSSFGFVLLGAAMEGAAHQPFTTIVEGEILRPLKLTHTRMGPRAEGKERSHTGEYWMTGSQKIVPFKPADVSCRLPAGGVVSTAEDLARFAAAHVHGRFFKPRTVELLFTSQRLADGAETGVGMGWRIGRDDKGRKFVHHGGTGGGRAFVLLYPSEDVAVSLCSNLANAAFAEDEALAIAKPFLDARP